MELEKAKTALPPSNKYQVVWEVHQEQIKGGKRSSNQPSKRWGHSSCLYRHYLYLFGGNLSSNNYANGQSLYIFDLKAWGDTSWDRYLPSETEPPAPTARDGHSATVIDHKMYILCGTKQKVTTNECWAFDLRSQLWCLRRIEGDHIEPREAHVALHDDKHHIVLHGGYGIKNPEQELVVINVKEDRASLVRDMKGVSPGIRESHSAVRHEDKYLLYGGIKIIKGTNEKGENTKTYIICNDLWSLSLKEIPAGGFRASWTHIQTEDSFPPLNSTMCVIYRKDYLILIGGDESGEQVEEVEGVQNEQESTQDAVTNTVYRLNLKTNKIVSIPQDPAASEFKPRMAHSGVIYQEKIYVFGGLERNRQFNSQFLRMDIRRNDSEDFKKLEDRQERLHDTKSILSETKNTSKCKFCDTRQVGAFPPQGSAHQVKKVWEDQSPLENKIKRRLSYLYYYVNCEADNGLLFLLYQMKVKEDKASPDPLEVNILCQRIKYSIPASEEEYKWREEKNDLKIIEIMESKNLSDVGSERSDPSDFDSRQKPAALNSKAKSVMNNNTRAKERQANTALGKREDETTRKSTNAQARASSKELAVANISKKLSERYQEKLKDPKNMVIISIPDWTINIKEILLALHSSMMDPESKAPTSFYLELALLLRFSSECLTVYRDSNDDLLFIYFKRLRNESVDSNGHLYSIVKTNLHYLLDLPPQDFPIKFKLLLKNISVYISTKKLMERIKHKGQNRHYFLFNPNYFGTSAKRSVYFHNEKKQFEVNYEDFSLDFSSKLSPRHAAIGVLLPLPSMFTLFDFDFNRFKADASDVQLIFRESYEHVLNTGKEEVNLLGEQTKLSYFENYFQTQKNYCKIIEELIDELKAEKKVHLLNNFLNHMIFDLDVMSQELEKKKKAPGSPIQSWFKFDEFENKAIFYSVSLQYKITNIIELPAGLAERIQFPAHNPSKAKLLGIFSFQTQEDYRDIIKQLFNTDVV